MVRNRARTGEEISRHRYVHPQTIARTHTHTHTHSHTHTRTRIHTQIHTDTHRHKDTHMHEHTSTKTRMHASQGLPFSRASTSLTFFVSPWFVTAVFA